MSIKRPNDSRIIAAIDDIVIAYVERLQTCVGMVIIKIYNNVIVICDKYEPLTPSDKSKYFSIALLYSIFYLANKKKKSPLDIAIKVRIKPDKIELQDYLRFIGGNYVMLNNTKTVVDKIEQMCIPPPPPPIMCSDSAPVVAIPVAAVPVAAVPVAAVPVPAMADSDGFVDVTDSEDSEQTVSFSQPNAIPSGATESGFFFNSG